MLTLTNNQIANAQTPSDARAVSVLAAQIADQVTATSPAIPATLTRINVRMFLTSLALHGIDTVDVQSSITLRYFAAGRAMTRAPYVGRWRSILVARGMTNDAKIAQLSQLLTQAEAAQQ